jgi:hypothetical protein
MKQVNISMATLNQDVIKHVIKKCKAEMDLSQFGLLDHIGGKEDAVETYKAILLMLEQMK